jgi:hypothetical protein
MTGGSLGAGHTKQRHAELANNSRELRIIGRQDGETWANDPLNWHPRKPDNWDTMERAQHPILDMESGEPWIMN